MSASIQDIVKHFQGRFLTEPALILEKLSHIKAYVFDWDGVFNNGAKDEKGSSPFSEIDSMGVNMLRFCHYLRTGKPPVVAIISGEKNASAFTLAEREHFNAAYYKALHKKEAFQHFVTRFNILPQEVAFVFDDVLDLSITLDCGLRIMVGRPFCNPLLIDFAIANNMVDYITYSDGGKHAVREASELLIGLTGRYEDTISQRVSNTGNYQQYMQMRNSVEPLFYTVVDSIITERSPK